MLKDYVSLVEGQTFVFYVSQIQLVFPTSTQKLGGKKKFFKKGETKWAQNGAMGEEKFLLPPKMLFDMESTLEKICFPDFAVPHGIHLQTDLQNWGNNSPQHGFHSGKCITVV